MFRISVFFAAAMLRLCQRAGSQHNHHPDGEGNHREYHHPTDYGHRNGHFQPGNS